MDATTLREMPSSLNDACRKLEAVEIERLQAAKCAALKLADERAKESNAMRRENERLRAFIWTLDGKTICIRSDGDTFVDDGIIVATDILGPPQAFVDAKAERDAGWPDRDNEQKASK